MTGYNYPKKMQYIRSAIVIYIRIWRRSSSTSNRAFIFGVYVGMCGVLGVDGADYAHTYDQLKRIMEVIE